MKTLTEFPVAQFKSAAALQKELASVGKTPEEIPQGIGEALKLEGDRLNWFMSALEVVGGETSDLKRVVVFTLAEGEKAPNGSVQKGEQYYIAEYYPAIAPKTNNRKFEGKRPGKRGERKQGKKGPRGEKRGGRGGSTPPLAASPAGTEKKIVIPSLQTSATSKPEISRG